MEKFLFILIIIWFIQGEYCKCQNNIDELIASVTEELMSSDYSEEELKLIIDELMDVFENPFDINEVNAEELKKLIFLNDFQIFTFLDYREKYGRIIHLKEIELVPGINNNEIQLLQKFLTLNPKIVATKKKSGLKASILNRYKIESPDRSGFMPNEDSTITFSGPDIYRLIKFKAEYNNKYSAGITMESDPGEERIFNKGFDFYSGFLMSRNNEKVFRKIILGNFRIQSGSGLIFGTGMAGKSTQIIPKQNFTSLKSNSSSSEYGNMTGFASELKFGKFSMIPFISLTKSSGTLTDSTLVISSIYKSGLFRNTNELNKKRIFTLLQTGVITKFQWEKLSMYHNIRFMKYSKATEERILPDRYSETMLLRKFLNQSISYSYHNHRYFFSGEFAADQFSSIAFTQISSCYLHPLITLSLIYRYFSPEFQSLGASGFSEKSGVKNETGCYFGLESYPIRHLKLGYYIDIYRFPWLNYNDIAPNSGVDQFLKAEWTISKTFHLNQLIKWETSQYKIQDEIGKTGLMREEIRLRILTQSDYELNPTTLLRNKFEIKISASASGGNLTGFLMYQEIKKSCIDDALCLQLRYTIFDIPHWNERIYCYEPDLLYSFSTPCYYRKGQHVLINMRLKIRKINLGLKYNETFYNNLISSGSGPDLRTGKSFRNLKFQWILKF